MAADRLTWLGHATVLLELGGARFVTDPVLRARVAHLRREVPRPGPIGPARRRADLARPPRPPRPARRCAASTRSAPVLAPPDSGWALRLGGHLVRTVHAGRRGRARGRPRAGGRRRPTTAGGCRSARPTSAVGFVAAGVYFAGDTEPFPEMAELAGTLDVALIPVAGWGPKVGPGHMDPREAAEALAMLRPAMAVPIHWGTYRRIGHRGTGDPAREFVEHAAELAPEVRIVVLQPGGSVEITRAV